MRVFGLFLQRGRKFSPSPFPFCPKCNIIRTENPAAAPEAARHAERKAELKMEKTRCKLNICGVEVTVSGDADRDAAEQIAGAVRARMERVLSTAYAASVEKAAVITAMNLC